MPITRETNHWRNGAIGLAAGGVLIVLQGQIEAVLHGATKAPFAITSLQAIGASTVLMLALRPLFGRWLARADWPYTLLYPLGLAAILFVIGLYALGDTPLPALRNSANLASIFMVMIAWSGQKNPWARSRPAEPPVS